MSRQVKLEGNFSVMKPLSRKVGKSLVYKEKICMARTSPNSRLEWSYFSKSTQPDMSLEVSKTERKV